MTTLIVGLVMFVIGVFVGMQQKIPKQGYTPIVKKTKNPPKFSKPKKILTPEEIARKEEERKKKILDKQWEKLWAWFYSH